MKSKIENGTLQMDCKHCVKQNEVLYPVVINIPLERIGIDCVQAIEKFLDEELKHQGFTRKTSTKGDKIVFNYWEFGTPVNP